MRHPFIAAEQTNAAEQLASGHPDNAHLLMRYAGVAPKETESAGAISCVDIRPNMAFDRLVSRVALTVRKLALAASDKLGYDCYIHAALGCQLLKDSGVDARLVVGDAAWQLGPRKQDVISYIHSGPLPTNPAESLAYHTWIDCYDLVIDISTYQLRMKAELLDAEDGSNTIVEWCPDYVILPRRELPSLAHFDSARRIGMCYYNERPELDAMLSRDWTLSPYDLGMARLVFRDPERLRVVGPCSASRSTGTDPASTSP